jgi:hypothetical protein
VLKTRGHSSLAQVEISALASSLSDVMLFSLGTYWEMERGAPMEGWNLGLSPGFSLDVMAGYGEIVKRWGVWVRGAMAVIMLCAAGLASPAWRVVQLLPLTGGVLLAWLDAYPPASDVLLGSRALRRWVDARTAVVSKTATINLAGLLEGFGVVAVALLFAGPLPVSMPAGLRLAGAAALTAFCWDAFSQVVGDAGYYNADRPADRWVIAVRWLLPLAAAGSAFVLFAGAGAGGTAAMRLPFWPAVMLSGSFLLLWPYIGMLNLLLQYACSAASDQVSRNLDLRRLFDQEYLHRAKNELRRPVSGNTTSEAEHEAYAAAVVALANADRDMAALASAGEDDAHRAAELWSTYHMSMGDTNLRDLLRYTDRTGGRKLSHLDGLILQDIFVGLVSNALRAHPEQVDVTVSEDIDPTGMPLIEVVVEDDGDGDAPTFFRPGSGLARLDELCRLRGGGVHVEARKDAGTRCKARFSCPHELAGSTSSTSDPQHEEREYGQVPGTGGRRWPIGNNSRRRLAAPGS